MFLLSSSLITFDIFFEASNNELPVNNVLKYGLFSDICYCNWFKFWLFCLFSSNESSSET
jgi:hypothetical protein